MPSSESYMLAVKVLASLAVNDFEAQLPIQGINSWTGPTGAIISAHGISTRSRLPQKILMWGLARVMNELVLHGFNGGVWDLNIQGRKVGQLLFIYQSTDLSIANSFTADFGDRVPNLTTDALQPAVTTDLTVATGTVTWTYEFYGDLMTLADVYMGAIGALISVARENNQNKDMFVGFFPQYKAIYTYLAIGSPSRLNKRIIIQTIFNMVSRAQAQNNWHEQKTVISDGQGQFASGGYIENPMLPLNSISTS